MHHAYPFGRPPRRFEKCIVDAIGIGLQIFFGILIEIWPGCRVPHVGA